MEVDFSKETKVYEDYVNNPEDRKALRKFCKVFPKEIARDAVIRHEQFLHYASALAYNQVYGSTANRIEIKRSTAHKDPLLLKVRVTLSYREFFHICLGDSPTPLLKTGEWNGQFGDVRHILVTEVNKHDYK